MWIPTRTGLSCMLKHLTKSQDEQAGKQSKESRWCVLPPCWVEDSLSYWRGENRKRERERGRKIRDIQLQTENLSRRLQVGGQKGKRQRKRGRKNQTEDWQTKKMARGKFWPYCPYLSERFSSHVVLYLLSLPLYFLCLSQIAFSAFLTEQTPSSPTGMPAPPSS